MADPVVWFAANAILDGVDPFGTDTRSLILYAAYRKRQYIDSLRTLLAASSAMEPRKVIEIARQTVDAIIPPDPSVLVSMKDALAELSNIESIEVRRIFNPAGAPPPPR